MRAVEMILIMMLIICSAVEAADRPKYGIKVSVMSEDAKSAAQGTGECVIDEDSYGRVNLALIKGGRGFKITAVGPSQYPVMHLVDQGGSRFADEYMAVIDLYLRPTATRDKDIRLEGYIGKMFNVGEKKSLYEYSEEKFEFIIPNGGEHTITIATPFGERKIFLGITAYSKGELVYKPEYDRELKLKAEYKLFNFDSGTVELENDDCVMLKKTGGDADKRSCTYKRLFSLPDGDRLLFATICEIDNPGWNDDGTVSFDFLLSHIYAVNPEDTSMESTELKGEKISMTMFSKRLTVQSGERTEIEIPADKESPLPFKSGEMIALTNPEEFIPLEKMPELIEVAQPVYPREARKAGHEAKVTVRAFVGSDGAVKNAIVVDCTRPGHGFEEATLEAAYNSRYTPGMQDDRAVAVWVTYTVNFSLD